MNTNTLLKKISLSEKDFEDIAEAVRKAESRTTGEIALALTAESAGYAFWELLAAVTTSLVFLLCLVPLGPQIHLWLRSLFWGDVFWYTAVFYALCGILMSVFMYVLYNVPALDSLIIPAGAKTAAVTGRAMRHFAESGVYCTREHSGILIFISYFEREVRIVADRGISERISPDLWNLISDELSEGIGKRKTKDAIVSAVERCGDLLAEKFPADGENENELPDGLVILEKERWA
ncbi:MAG: TPM domain-containing protein [Treponema sp.]|nr:TPM domain-containing protein [Treponema sp.]